jgi:hypothetical protein
MNLLRSGRGLGGNSIAMRNGIRKLELFRGTEPVGLQRSGMPLARECEWSLSSSGPQVKISDCLLTEGQKS